MWNSFQLGGATVIWLGSVKVYEEIDVYFDPGWFLDEYVARIKNDRVRVQVGMLVGMPFEPERLQVGFKPCNQVTVDLRSNRTTN